MLDHAHVARKSSATTGANGVSVDRRWGQLRLGAGLAGPNHDRIVKPWALTVNGILKAPRQSAQRPPHEPAPSHPAPGPS